MISENSQLLEIFSYLIEQVFRINYFSTSTSNINTVAILSDVAYVLQYEVKDAELKYVNLFCGLLYTVHTYPRWKRIKYTIMIIVVTILAYDKLDNK